LRTFDRRAAGRNPHENVATRRQFLRRTHQGNTGLFRASLDQGLERAIEGVFVERGDLEQALVVESFAKRTPNFAKTDQAQLDLFALNHFSPPRCGCLTPKVERMWQRQRDPRDESN
jgi:hypothetical protein